MAGVCHSSSQLREGFTARSLCSLERESSNVPAAERDCREALALATELRGTNHHATIDARRQLAALHVDQGRFSDAEGELRDTLAWVTAYALRFNVEIPEDHLSRMLERLPPSRALGHAISGAPAAAPR